MAVQDVEKGCRSLDDREPGSSLENINGLLGNTGNDVPSVQDRIDEQIKVDSYQRLDEKVPSFKRNGEMALLYQEQKDSGKWRTFVLAYQTLGVVYGDLGTSPLYVFPTVNINSPKEEDFLGILSIIFWTLTLMGVIKYVFIVLRADDHGEGGTFALYSLLCRHANLGMHTGRQGSRLKSDMQLSHYGSLRTFHSRTKDFLQTSKAAQKTLLFIVMMGTCMIMGDGVLTPAISVLSAIGGLKSESSHISQTVVVLISTVVLIGLFVLQSKGTSKVSFLFSPIMVAWFVSTPMIGAYNIGKHYPQIFKALSPHYIIKFFQRNKEEGWKMLGGVFLCITGAEAMFADLGHFNKRSIQIAFSTLVYPSLIITYAGEAAYLVKHPENVGDAFFKSIPHPVYWPMFCISTLAAVVASQSLISATFSIIKQSMALGCFPRVKLVHTSKNQEGQIYSPEINYILLILCLAIVIGFRDGTQIGNAFGVAVVFVMIITTLLVTLVMLVIWSTPLPLVLIFLFVYISIESVYMTSVLNKVPQGGWVPFAIATFFLLVMLTWDFGRKKKYEVEVANKISPESLSSLLATPQLNRTQGLCFFYSELIQGIPPIISQYVKVVGSVHKIVVFINIRFIPVTTVLRSERIFVGRKGCRGIYWCVARYGYMDVIDLEGEEFVNEVIEKLIEYVNTIEDPSSGYDDVGARENKLSISQDTDSQLLGPRKSTSDTALLDSSTHQEVLDLQQVCRRDAVHVVGKVTLVSGRNTNWIENIILNKLYRLLQNSCRSSTAAFHLPSSRLLQVGMVYEL